jgi:hypothetical protein
MKDLFQLLKKHKLSPNGYYILYCLDSNLDYRQLPVTAAAELTKLKHYGYIDKETGHLTKEAKLMLIEASKLFLRTAKTIQDELGNEFAENVKKYRDLFPAGIQHGRALRTSATDLSPRFVWFFKTFPAITWDMIFRATEKYIDSFGRDLTYCKNSSYFIKKDDKSKSTICELATWCENLEEEDVDTTHGDYGGFNDVI